MDQREGSRRIRGGGRAGTALEKPELRRKGGSSSRRGRDPAGSRSLSQDAFDALYPGRGSLWERGGDPLFLLGGKKKSCYHEEKDLTSHAIMLRTNCRKRNSTLKKKKNRSAEEIPVQKRTLFDRIVLESMSMAVYFHHRSLPLARGKKKRLSSGSEGGFLSERAL